MTFDISVNQSVLVALYSASDTIFGSEAAPLYTSLRNTEAGYNYTYKSRSNFRIASRRGRICVAVFTPFKLGLDLLVFKNYFPHS